MAAPKNNQFALGNNGGRPPKYESAEDLQDAIDDYFDQTSGDDSLITVTGLALHLGFESRQSLYDYQQREEFSYIIARAKLRVEHSYELRLMGSNVRGSIFALKQMGWSDKSELDLKSSDGSMSPQTLDDFYSEVNGESSDSD